MQEHMRIGLLDPRWLEQRDRSIREKQSDDEVYAPGEMQVPARAQLSSCRVRVVRPVRVWELDAASDTAKIICIFQDTVEESSKGWR